MEGSLASAALGLGPELTELTTQRRREQPEF